MIKYKAENCKNYTPNGCPILNDKDIIILCARRNCTDRRNCDGMVREETKETHFESVN